MLGNFIMIIGTIIASILVGTGIRLYYLGVNNVIIYALLIPLLLFKINLGFVLGKSEPINRKGLKTIFVMYNRLIFVISSTPSEIALGCNVAREVQARHKENNKNRYEEYTSKYKKEVIANFRYA